jgi:hypothetical protein
MSMVYVIIVLNFLHQQQGYKPERYPDLQSCQVALAQTQFQIGYWGQCRAISVLPSQGRYR